MENSKPYHPPARNLLKWSEMAPKAGVGLAAAADEFSPAPSGQEKRGGRGGGIIRFTLPLIRAGVKGRGGERTFFPAG